MAGFATKSEQDYWGGQKENQIWEWVNNVGNGLMGYGYGEEIPDACFQFCLDQYARFNIPMTSELAEVITLGASMAFYFLDNANPYALFEGISDVDLSSDWAHVTYQIFDPAAPDRKSYEPDPQFVESFVFVPGQSEEMFNTHMARPGLKALPLYHGSEIEELLDGSAYGEAIVHQLSKDGLTALEQACLVEVAPGEYRIDEGRQMAYFELAAWAGYLWLAGPPGREFRLARHDIIGTAILDGECILVDGTIISPKYYNKLDRPPQSCNKCGVQTWCVEPTQILNHTGLICEACLNFDMPKFRNANCGSKFCTFSPCPNHPYHSQGMGGMMRAHRENGQLSAIAKGQSIHQVMGQVPNLKRLGF